MKSLALRGVLFFMTAVIVPCKGQKIIVRAIDSKTGEVLHGYDSYNPVAVWLYDSTKKQIPTSMTTETYHQLFLETHNVKNAASLQIFSNGYVDCRNVKNGVGPFYSVTEILLHGVVTENHCGSRTLLPTPGMIVLFVRPANWFERHFRE